MFYFEQVAFDVPFGGLCREVRHTLERGEGCRSGTDTVEVSAG